MTPTWTAPSRLPTRDELEPQLPHDVEALVRAGHLLRVAPGMYRRRAPTPDTAPSRRALLDHCVTRVVDALLAGDGDAARLFHRAARIVQASVGAGEHEHEHEPTTASYDAVGHLSPTWHQHLPPTRPTQTTDDADPANTPTAAPSPVRQAHGCHHDGQAPRTGGLPQDSQPQDDRRTSLLSPMFYGFGHGSAPPPYPAGVVEIPYTVGDLVAVWSVLPSRPSVKRRQPMIFLRWRQRRPWFALGIRPWGAMDEVVRPLRCAVTPTSATAGTPFTTTQPPRGQRNDG